jgi:hypothetical protein
MKTWCGAMVRRLSMPLVIVFVAFGAGAGLASRTSLRTVRITSEGGATVVALDADGALPMPTVGVVADPPRVYLDFRDVTTATRGTVVTGNALVRGVRVAVNQAQPLVTRVVIDLVAPARHSVDTAMRERGHVSIVVGNPVPPVGGVPAAPPGKPANTPSPADAPAPPQLAAPAPAAQPQLPTPTPPGVIVPPSSPVAPVTPLPSRAATPPPAPPPSPPETDNRARTFAEFALNARASTVRVPERDIERYMRAASASLERLMALRALLVSLDALAPLPEERLTSAAREFDAIQRALSAIEPPRTLNATHEELRRVCGLGAAAARARLDRTVGDDATRGWNAASAAAGAIMLLERARAGLGLAGSTSGAPRLP